MNKEDRIRLYLGTTVEEGRLYIREGLFALRSQVTSFPHGKMKDGIDALAYAVKHSSKPSTSEEQQDMRDEREAAAVAHPPRVNSKHFYGGYA